MKSCEASFDRIKGACQPSPAARTGQSRDGEDPSILAVYNGASGINQEALHSHRAKDTSLSFRADPLRDPLFS